MKYLITISNSNGQILYSGKPIALPLKEESITQKSIELFGDAEPCIIHQSYASQKLVDDFIGFFPDLPLNRLLLMDYKKKLDFIDIRDIETCFLTIEVKK